MEQEIITYYPSDQMVLEVEIEHQPNFRNVTAIFIAHPDSETAVPRPHRSSMATSQVIVQEVQTDGTKISRVRFEKSVSRNDWIPGHTYELVELRAETVGTLPGESGSGNLVIIRRWRHSQAPLPLRGRNRAAPRSGQER